MKKIAMLAVVTALGLAGGLAIAGPVSAAAPEGVMKYAINKPSISWNVYGPGQTNASVKDKGVVGGGAVRVQVTAPTPGQPWANAAGQAVDGKITKGDIVTVAFWARAESVDGGPATATISSVGVHQSASPWSGIVNGQVETIGGEWKLYTFSGRASIDADKGTAGVSLQLGGAKQTVVLGPLFVLDFGTNYDPSMVAK